MMKTIAALAFIGAAAAFAPAQQGRVNTAVSLDISNELGAQMPVSYFLPQTAVDLSLILVPHRRMFRHRRNRLQRYFLRCIYDF
jgi:hypothetical protein